MGDAQDSRDTGRHCGRYSSNRLRGNRYLNLGTIGRHIEKHQGDAQETRETRRETRQQPTWGSAYLNLGTTGNQTQEILVDAAGDPGLQRPESRSLGRHNEERLGDTAGDTAGDTPKKPTWGRGFLNLRAPEGHSIRETPW